MLLTTRLSPSERTTAKTSLIIDVVVYCARSLQAANDECAARDICPFWCRPFWRLGPGVGRCGCDMRRHGAGAKPDGCARLGLPEQSQHSFPARPTPQPGRGGQSGAFG